MKVASVAIAAALTTLLALAAPAGATTTVPSGFSDRLVTVVPRATGMDWTPDGRMVIVTHPGFVRIFKNGALNATPALDHRTAVCRNDEWGMEGITVDPNFATTHFVYIYYTAKKFGGCEQNSPNSPVNRVSRFVLGDDDVIDPLSEMPIVDGIPGPAGVHAGGDLEFGSDGFLYISAGDGGCDFRGDSGCFPLNDVAQDLGALAGKILRVTKNGGIPSSNPFRGQGTTRCSPTGYTATTTKCQEIYSYGLRNPFRIGLDPNAPAGNVRFNIHDVGLSTWEEVNAGQAGANYGWNVREGPCVRDSSTNCGPPPAGMTNPIHSYNHDTGCVSITGGDFVPAGAWPQQYDDAYLFGDLVCEKVWALEPDGSGGYAATEFATGIPFLIDGVFGPDGATKSFYYISWVGFPNDEIRQIRYTGVGNRLPTASISANPTSGALPLQMSFNGSGSSDPDGDTLTYDWDFGDGSAHSTNPNPNHTYGQAGIYTARLTVSDGHADGTDTASVQIQADNTAPVPTITSPLASELFSVGEQLVLNGTATDQQDGPLPSSSLVWRVERHHSTHAHPVLPETNGTGIPITGPAPEDLSATTNTYLEIILTVTDSDGLSATVTRNVYPQTTALSFQTAPAGLALEVAGSALTGPQSVTSWDGWQLPITAPEQYAANGRLWLFDHWSDGGAATHMITTPAAAATYTATFRQYQYPRPGGGTPARVALVPAFRQCTSPNATHVAPLAFSSCTGPQMESSNVRITNGGKANSFARLTVQPGNLSTPADEEDVTIRTSIGDVISTANGTPDYAGKLLLHISMRITDSLSGPSQVTAATVQDATFRTPLDCVPVQGVFGSNCNLETTIDSLVPNFARERSRTIIATPTITALDAGPDGVITPASDPIGLGCPPTCGSGDESVFMRQGVFTP